MPAQITNDDHVVHRVVPKQEVRQGETSGHVRLVLSTSLALVIVATTAETPEQDRLRLDGLCRNRVGARQIP